MYLWFLYLKGKERCLLCFSATPTRQRLPIRECVSVLLWLQPFYSCNIILGCALSHHALDGWDAETTTLPFSISVFNWHAPQIYLKTASRLVLSPKDIYLTHVRWKKCLDLTTYRRSIMLVDWLNKRNEWTKKGEKKEEEDRKIKGEEKQGFLEALVIFSLIASHL